MSGFYCGQEEQSYIKATLVEKYFLAWARVMNNKSRSSRLGYIDLFCGPGVYDDGTHSTPLKVLDIILSHEDFRDKFVTIFNDKNENYIKTLEKEVSNLDNIAMLKHEPSFYCSEIGESFREQFDNVSIIPSFIFIDPWGYKGVTKSLIQSLTEDWGCDCVLFFNYNRINPAINNDIVQGHMRDLFGEDRYAQLKYKLETLSDVPREDVIINEFSESMKDCGINYILPFRFFSRNKKSTSHYLIFLTKNILGYKIMKEIMANASKRDRDRIGTFQYMPSNYQQLSFLGGFYHSISNLKSDLLNKFAGETLSVKGIYQKHNVNTPYILRNYKDALLELEEERKITTFPAIRSIRKGKKTMADHVKITFP